METTAPRPSLEDGFLYNILFAMRTFGTIMQTADYKAVTYEDGQWLIDSQPVDKQEAIKAIEYFYACDPSAVREDADYLSGLIFKYRMEN